MKVHSPKKNPNYLLTHKYFPTPSRFETIKSRFELDSSRLVLLKDSERRDCLVLKA